MIDAVREEEERVYINQRALKLGSWRAVAREMKEEGYEDRLVNTITRVMWGVLMEELR